MRHRHRSRLRVLVCLPVDLPKLIRRGTNHQIEETFHPTPRRFRVRERNFSSKEDAGPYHYQLRNVRARRKQHHLTRRSVRKQWNRIERFSVTEFVPFGALPRSLRSTWRLNAGFSRCTADDGPAARRCRITGKTTLSTDPRLTPPKKLERWASWELLGSRAGEPCVEDCGRYVP
jgi:hypothetical protein